MNKNIHTKPPSKLLCPQYGGPVRSFLGNHLHRSELRIEQKRPRERKRLIFLDEPEAFGEASEIIHHDSFVLHAEFIRPLADEAGIPLANVYKHNAHMILFQIRGC